jgi:prepilin-type N-terminal cleavage/methylation domain-containing protein
VTRRSRRGQRGFTLVELMVALAISAILVTMVLSVFARMSAAYRRQQQVASLQVILAAAENLLTQDARQAGFQMAQGFQLATAPGVRQRPVQVVNSSFGPDELRFFSADATVQSRVTAIAFDNVSVDINQFVDGELAVIVNTDTIDLPIGLGTRKIPRFESCVVRVNVVIGDPYRLNLDTSAPWGDATNSHCAAVIAAHTSGASQGQTMLYRFLARGYRIDPARPALGVLQLSPSGGLVAGDWQDLGIGFADLQVAARMFLSGDVVDEDGDGDNEYDWVSGSELDVRTAPTSASYVTSLTISLSARTDRSVDGVGAVATPSFLGTGAAGFNSLGDHPSVALPLAPSVFVYRYSTSRVDMRNTGAGL